MARTIVENPVIHSKMTADDRGRINLGKEFAGQTVNVIVEELDED